MGCVQISRGVFQSSADGGVIIDKPCDRVGVVDSPITVTFQVAAVIAENVDVGLAIVRRRHWRQCWTIVQLPWREPQTFEIFDHGCDDAVCQLRLINDIAGLQLCIDVPELRNAEKE